MTVRSAWARVGTAVHALAAGRMVIVRDHVDREDEGDLVLAADMATEQSIAFMAHLGGGLICVPIMLERSEVLQLLPISPVNMTRTQTAFLTPVDLVGSTTGISASERAATARALADPRVTADQFVSPGHMFPLRVHQDGLRGRVGHTEAAVELARWAGRRPAAVICEILGEDGVPLRGAGLDAFARRHGLPLVDIGDLVSYLEEGHGQVYRLGEARLPTRSGFFRVIVYEDPASGVEHLALLSGSPLPDSPSVRIHSECLTGDTLGSLRCDCGSQLETALHVIGRDGGIVLYLRQEGRGIGLGNKILAYALQDQGMDTVEANQALGLPADARDYTVAAAILHNLGVDSVRLMTNNPRKVEGLEAQGIQVIERVPLLPATAPESAAYLMTKAELLGHFIPHRERTKRETHHRR